MVSENTYHHVWHAHGAGTWLAQAEKEELQHILPTLYGFHLVQLGDPGLASLVSSSLIAHRLLINETIFKSWPSSYVQGSIETLSLLNDSVDVVVLTHTLEQAAHPHQVIREAHRVLIPEGHLVISGFNPLSWWGGWFVFKRAMGKIPSHHRMIAFNRVRDWLKLLDFQVVGGSMFYFRPPLVNDKFLRRLHFLERIGRRFVPFLGGAYTVVAVKRMRGITPVRPSWTLWTDPQGDLAK